MALNDQLELRKVVVSSLTTCMYLPCILTFISYKGYLYSVGNGSSSLILGLIFVTELVKSFYLNSRKKNKGNKNIIRDILLGFVCLLCTEFSFFILIVFIGAVLEWSEETMMLSSLLTLLTVFPLLLHIGVKPTLRLMFEGRNYGKLTIIEMLVCNAAMTVSGALFGAIVIPRNVTTPWQKWLIPSYLGAVGGFWLSNVLTVLKVIVMCPDN